MPRFDSIAEVKARNKESGRFFFSTSTMRFFDSHIGRKLYGGRFFITSERFHGSNGWSAPREYTIREAHYDGNIDTVGEFGAFANRKVAEAAIKALLGAE